MKASKILIIDDNVNIIDFIVETLEGDELNYEFYHATNGLDGLKVAKLFLPDIIITDWDMPGISGIETIKRLKQIDETKDTPVVMISGAMTTEENLKTAFEAGAIDYIRKPIEKLELLARTKSMLTLSKYYKQTIELKDNELKAMTLSILKAEKLTNGIIEQFIQISDIYSKEVPELKKDTANLAKLIVLNEKENAWSEFEKHFNNTHPSFYNELTKDFPNLTPTDLKIAMLTRLQLSSKKIATIIFMTPESVKTSRSRLRQKLHKNYN